MKVTVDLDTCQSHGQCAFAAPGVFELDDDDRLHYRQEVGEQELDLVRDAAATCPVAAISIADS